MSKISTKIIAVIVCAVLCLSGVVTSFALTGTKTEKPTEAPAAASDVSASAEIAKDETVYVLAGADGSVKKIIVSDWIKNALSASSVTDTTELSDIENVKGDESYTINGSAKVWDAQGNDIYYRGNIEKELPVGLSVTYKLDGKAVSADELAGKSGKVTIRFDYDNRQYENVTIDGKQEKIYVPFAMLTGMLLDNETFRNIEVSNGKLINDGDRTAVVGIALPGLQENLGIGKDALELPDYVEITADAVDFSFGMTVTIATNEIFNNIDTSKLSIADGFTDSVGELADGMKQLLDGSSVLYGGLAALLDKSGELVAGIEALAEGAGALNDGAAAVDAGAERLNSGAAELSGGLGTLKGSNATLNGGARQVFETLLATAETQIKAGGAEIPPLTVANYAEVLDALISSFDEKAVYEQAISENMAPEEVQAKLAAAKSIISLKASLDSYNAFYLGLLAYTDGVASAADGAAAIADGISGLKDGTAQLKDGASALYGGILQIKNGTPALADGVSKLKDGAMQLKDGLTLLDKDGISKIVELVGGDLKNITARLKATIEVSKNYRNFSGIGENTEGRVKFVYRTDEIASK